MAGPTIGIPAFGAPSSQIQGGVADPQADRKKTLLSKLKRDVATKRRTMPYVVALESLKGLKTVAALALPLVGCQSPKGGAVLETPGIPLPNGPVSVISYDHQTEGSLDGYYGTTQPAISRVLDDPEGVIPIRRLLGYNSGIPQTAIDVIDGTRALLQSWAEPGRQRSLLVVDRCDLLIEDIMKKGCYARAKKPLDGTMEKGDWGPRSNWVEEFIDLVISATSDGGLVILTGPPMKDEGRIKLTNVNGKWTMATVPSKWVERIEHHLNGHLTGVIGEDQKTRQVVRFVECDYSRIPYFPERIRVPINGRHLGAFLMKELHMEMEKDEDVLNVAALAKAVA